MNRTGPVTGIIELQQDSCNSGENGKSKYCFQPTTYRNKSDYLIQTNSSLDVAARPRERGRWDQAVPVEMKECQK